MILQAQIILDKDEMDQRGRPLYITILQWLVEHDIVDAAVFEGISGIGSNRRISRPGALFSFDEPPVMILFSDEASKVKNALHEIRAFCPTALMMSYQVEMH